MPAAASQQVAPSCSERPNGSCAAWVLADFDGDQKLDLAIADLPGEAGQGLRNVTVQSGLSYSIPIGMGRSNELLSARDLDGDADRDLVLYSAEAGLIAVWLNDGTGHFQRADVEAFRYQFSHDDSRSLESAPPVTLLQDAADHSRTDLGVAVHACGPYAAVEPLLWKRERSVTAGFWFRVFARGPPSSL